MTTIQERLRNYIGIAHIDNCHLVMQEAADIIDALEANNRELLDQRFDLMEQGAEYRKCADDAAMAHKVERDGLMVKVDALTRAMKPALAAMNSISVNCENFHHRKKDQHEPGAECKPRRRYLVAFRALEKAIAQGKV